MKGLVLALLATNVYLIKNGQVHLFILIFMISCGAFDDVHQKLARYSNGSLGGAVLWLNRFVVPALGTRPPALSQAARCD